MPESRTENLVAILLASPDRKLSRQVTRALTIERVPHRIYWVVEPELLIAQAQQLRPDVILVDTRSRSEAAMPAVIELARAAPWSAVIVMTDGDWALPAGASDSVRLPLDAADLAASVRHEGKRSGPVAGAAGMPPYGAAGMPPDVTAGMPSDGAATREAGSASSVSRAEAQPSAPESGVAIGSPPPASNPERYVYAVASQTDPLQDDASPARPQRRLGVRVVIAALALALLIAAGALIVLGVNSARQVDAATATAAPASLATLPESLPAEGQPAALTGTPVAPDAGAGSVPTVTEEPALLPETVVPTPAAALTAAPAPTSAPTFTATPLPTARPAPAAIATPTATRPFPTPVARATATSAGLPATPVSGTRPGLATALPMTGATPAGLPGVSSLRLSPPAPAAPAAGALVHGPTLFQWLATGPLPPGSGYELVWWNVDENPSSARGIAPPGQATTLTVNLDVLYESHQLHDRDFYWTVLIVQLAPYGRLTQPAGSVPQLLTYQP